MIKEEFVHLQAACNEFEKGYSPKFVVVGVTHVSGFGLQEKLGDLNLMIVQIRQCL